MSNIRIKASYKARRPPAEARPCEVWPTCESAHVCQRLEHDQSRTWRTWWVETWGPRYSWGQVQLPNRSSGPSVNQFSYIHTGCAPITPGTLTDGGAVRKHRGAPLLTSIPQFLDKCGSISPPPGTLIYYAQYSQVRNVGTFLASEHGPPSGQFPSHVGSSRQTVCGYPTYWYELTIQWSNLKTLHVCGETQLWSSVGTVSLYIF